MLLSVSVAVGVCLCVPVGQRCDVRRTPVRVVGVYTPPSVLIRHAKLSFGLALCARCQLSTTVGTQLLKMRGSDVFNINTAQHRYVTCT